MDDYLSCEAGALYFDMGAMLKSVGMDEIKSELEAIPFVGSTLGAIAECSGASDYVDKWLKEHGAGK